jgi:7,8-dihydropterin-6-yl-methyl-4-(beta-D-ribofuranosyl)aminobenzene 5'-phosphate synthase
MITGEMPRVTDFEKGFPLQYKEQDNEIDLVPDPLVSDEQALIMNVRNKGLIILTDCVHAGIINTIKSCEKSYRYSKDILRYSEISFIRRGL